MNFEIDGHQMMLMMDPPKHTQYRRLISSEFTPRGARELAPRVRELAAMIVDRVIERGECDLVEDIAGELPSYVIAELLGIPLEDGRKLYRLTETIHSAPETPAAGRAARRGDGDVPVRGGGDRARSARTPRDDLATKLLNAEVDGRRFDDIDFNLFFMLLVDAGGDTTRNLVGGRNARAVRAPRRARASSRADLDALLPSAVEEMLRWVSPGDLHAPHGDARHGARRREDPRGAEGRHVLRLREPRRVGVRRARPLRRGARRRTCTSRSAAASTSASARTSRASRSRPCCARS